MEPNRMGGRDGKAAEGTALKHVAAPVVAAAVVLLTATACADALGGTEV